MCAWLCIETSLNSISIQTTLLLHYTFTLLNYSLHLDFLQSGDKNSNCCIAKLCAREYCFPCFFPVIWMFDCILSVWKIIWKWKPENVKYSDKREMEILWSVESDKSLVQILTDLKTASVYQLRKIRKNIYFINTIVLLLKKVCFWCQWNCAMIQIGFYVFCLL